MNPAALMCWEPESERKHFFRKCEWFLSIFHNARLSINCAELWYTCSIKIAIFISIIVLHIRLLINIFNDTVQIKTKAEYQKKDMHKKVFNKIILQVLAYPFISLNNFKPSRVL